MHACYSRRAPIHGPCLFCHIQMGGKKCMIVCFVLLRALAQAAGYQLYSLLHSSHNVVVLP